MALSPPGSTDFLQDKAPPWVLAILYQTHHGLPELLWGEPLCPAQPQLPGPKSRPQLDMAGG